MKSWWFQKIHYKLYVKQYIGKLSYVSRGNRQFETSPFILQTLKESQSNFDSKTEETQKKGTLYV